MIKKTKFWCKFNYQCSYSCLTAYDILCMHANIFFLENKGRLNHLTEYYKNIYETQEIFSAYFLYVYKYKKKYLASKIYQWSI